MNESKIEITNEAMTRTIIQGGCGGGDVVIIAFLPNEIMLFAIQLDYTAWQIHLAFNIAVSLCRLTTLFDLAILLHLRLFNNVIWLRRGEPLFFLDDLLQIPRAESLIRKAVRSLQNCRLISHELETWGKKPSDEKRESVQSIQHCKSLSIDFPL